jgi:hypothetical protein
LIIEQLSSRRIYSGLSSDLLLAHEHQPTH